MSTITGIVPQEKGFSDFIRSHPIVALRCIAPLYIIVRPNARAKTSEAIVVETARTP